MPGDGSLGEPAEGEQAGGVAVQGEHAPALGRRIHEGALVQRCDSPHLTASLSRASLLHTPSQRFERMASKMEERSKGVPSALSLKEGIRLPVLGEVKWVDLQRDLWAWLKSPLNLVILLWMVLVAVSGALLFLVMTGMLNAVIPNEDTRDTWFEVNNQIINGLFTLMCVIVHPGRILAAVRLYRWRPEDIVAMRAEYNKGGVRKRDEWKHMVVVVLLLNLNCVFQYILAGFNWGYSREERPPLGVALSLTGAIGCGAAAGIYNALSPLGKETPGDLLTADEVAMEEGGGMHERLEDKKAYLDLQDPLEAPQWQGGVIGGFCRNARIALLSTLCCICVFGINQERLGFGDKFVHIITFALFLFAPFLIFALSAINIDDTNLRQAIGLVGISISLLGVMYGGYWRWRMRVTYKLPKTRWCLGHAGTTDMATWLLCSCCALAQEVRTAEHYDPHKGRMYLRNPDLDDGDLHNKKGFRHVLEMIPSNPELETTMVEVEMQAPEPMAMEAPMGSPDVKQATVV